MKVLSDTTVKRIKEEILPRYPEVTSAILPSLWEVQRELGWVSADAVKDIAEVLNVPAELVFDTLSFYTMFQKRPVGKFHIQVCTNVSCDLLGAMGVVEAFKKQLGVEVGETTQDGMFSLSTVECLGACGEAVVVQINDEYYTGVTPEKVAEILETLKRSA